MITTTDCTVRQFCLLLGGIAEVWVSQPNQENTTNIVTGRRGQNPPFFQSWGLSKHYHEDILPSITYFGRMTDEPVLLFLQIFIFGRRADDPVPLFIQIFIDPVPLFLQIIYLRTTDRRSGTTFPPNFLDFGRRTDHPVPLFLQISLTSDDGQTIRYHFSSKYFIFGRRTDSLTS